MTEAKSSIADVIAEMNGRGIILWAEGGRLRYRAPRGAFTERELEFLRAEKGSIIRLLETQSEMMAREAMHERRPPYDTAPLAFSQLAHWKLHHLGERSSTCWVWTAVRLTGQLDIELLRSSILGNVCRHDALRTKIRVTNGALSQEITQHQNHELVVEDLTVLSTGVRVLEAQRRIDSYVSRHVDVCRDCLFGTKVLKLGENDHVFVVTMEHIICDGLSMGILLRDIFGAYEQVLTGRGPSLPDIPMQFSEFAMQQNRRREEWVARNSEYWAQHFRGCRRVRFPLSSEVSVDPASGWGVLPLRIDRQLTHKLRWWARRHGTTLVMSILTAYVALILRWCNVSDAVVLYESDGRWQDVWMNTIGYFASPLCLRVGLDGGDAFQDLLKRITEEYCAAYEHIDLSYFQAHDPPLEFARNTCFDWIPNANAQLTPSLQGTSHALDCSPFPVEQRTLRGYERDTEPVIILYESDEEVHGRLLFPLRRVSWASMERFGRNFHAFVSSLAQGSEERIEQISLVE